MKKTVFAAAIAMLIICLPAMGWTEAQPDHVCFRTMDGDNNGVVTFEEFKKFYGDDEKKFNDTDLNKDGGLTHDEYHALLGHGAAK